MSTPTHRQVARYADMFAAIGNEARLRILRLLLSAHPDGLVVGDIQAELGIPNSTLSHHLAQLVNAGLVRQERQGRVLRCTPDYALMDALIGYLTEECCQGLSRSAPAREAG